MFFNTPLKSKEKEDIVIMGSREVYKGLRGRYTPLLHVSRKNKYITKILPEGLLELLLQSLFILLYQKLCGQLTELPELKETAAIFVNLVNNLSQGTGLHLIDVFLKKS